MREGSLTGPKPSKWLVVGGPGKSDLGDGNLLTAAGELAGQVGVKVACAALGVARATSSPATPGSGSPGPSLPGR